uniref:Uncharacterized protein n=1 Tax=Meloidogyne javanica TaxID=6303 RepID=A0A915LFT8_MELJA
MSQIIPESNPASPPPAIPDSKTSLKSTYPEQLWKLVKGKTVLQYHLCHDCQNRLFHSSDKVIRNGDSVIIKIEMCNDCVKDNFTLPDEDFWRAMDEAEAERALNREPSSDESDEEALIRVPRRRNNGAPQRTLQQLNPVPRNVGGQQQRQNVEEEEERMRVEFSPKAEGEKNYAE